MTPEEAERERIRREEDRSVLKIVAAMAQDISSLHGKIDNIDTKQSVTDRKLDDHMRDETDQFKTMVKDIVRELVPDGDIRGHHDAHQAMIAKAQAEATFYNRLKADLASKGLWGLILVLGAVLWYAAKKKVGIE